MVFSEKTLTDIRHLDYLIDRVWEKFFLRTCGLDFIQYWLHEEILTQDILETHLDDIIDKVIGFMDYIYNPLIKPRLPTYDGYWINSIDDILIGLQILGILILQTGANLPEFVRRGILYSTLWTYDKRRGWGISFEDKRKRNLEKFREAIFNHKKDQHIEISF